MATGYDFTKYKKLCAGGGAIAVFGAIIHEYVGFKRRLNSLINADLCDLERKRPDYIYIKYHIYKESMLLREHEELANKYWVNVIINPIGKWWKAIKHSVAWRLLEVARTGDHSERLKAVKQLAQIDHLKDWDYQHLAQICDARTAISLARNNCDVRWFLPPKALGALREPKSLIYDLRAHLTTLLPCTCLSYFQSNTFDKYSILKLYEYTTTTSTKGVKVTNLEYDNLRRILEALFHMTRSKENSMSLIDSGILTTLMEILKLFHNDIDIRFLLSKILANLSICRELNNDFFVTGWVGVLARWKQNPDVRVQVTAAKSLANMDDDDKFSHEYHTNLYPLYPLAREPKKRKLDVVFIHGLLGGVFVTWRQKDPKEADLGLYGKHHDESHNDCHDLFLVDEIITNDRQNNVRHTIGSSAWGREWKTITYSESALIGTKPRQKKQPVVSDIATKELIETLQSANELDSEYEVVFPDCPINGNANADGPFSVSGDKWINADDSGEYTYCWPMDWLPQEYPDLRVIGLNYETSISEWSPGLVCPCDRNKSSLHERSKEFLQSLVTAGVGRDCPVVWVCHSMGGLVAKSIIVQALNDLDPSVRAIGENTGAILFLGTPHKGSPVAKLKHHVQLIFSPTIEVKELRENCQLLLQLQSQFEEALTKLKRPIKIVSIAEGLPTAITTFKFPMQFVNEESAKLNIGDFYVLNVDHLGLCKPVFRQSFLYQRLLAIINDVINTITDEEHKN